MDKFRQISTELLPLIYVNNSFNALSWAFLAVCLQTLYSSRYLGGVVWDFRQISPELVPLVKIDFGA